MRRVIIESPYAGTPEEIKRNIRYARACMVDCLRRGDAPFASHLLFTQPGILRDDVPSERRRGIEAGLAWGAAADATLAYLDLGVSSGMEHGIRRALSEGRAIDLCWLPYGELEAAIGTREALKARAAHRLELGRMTVRDLIGSERKVVT
jgi:hypothetical protein